MSHYFFNEGTFDSLDIGLVDSTIHVLQFADETRLFIDRKPLRVGATPRDLATARTELDARVLQKLTVMDQRDSGSAFDVAAYYRDGDDLVYQLQRHFVRPPSAFTFTLRGPMAARGDIDARMDRLFATLRFRRDG